jgi:DNA-binding MarR family transcriptional regulator
MVAVSPRTRSSPRPADRGALGEELVVSLHMVTKSLLHRLHPVLDEEGISMAQFWALHLVSGLRSASVSTVARHLAVSAPTICASIDQLEEGGLIVRRRSERDRRAVDISLTARGRRVEARVWQEAGRLMAASVVDLPFEDLATALRVFRELEGRLARDEERAAEAA